MKPTTRYASALMASIAAVLFSGAVPSQAQPVEIRAAWTVPAPINFFPLFETKPNVMKHYGKSYTLKPVYFRATPLMTQGLASNEIDIALLGPATLNVAVINAGFKDLRILADEIRDGADGYYASAYLVLKDSPIKSAADLKGKTLANFGIGTAADLAMKNYLAKHGLLDKRDYSMIEVALPNLKAVLLEKKADLAFNAPPFLYDPELQEKSRVLFTARDSYGAATSPAFWTMRESFVQKNRAAIVDLLEDYLRLGRWFYDPANRSEAVDIISALNKQPRAVIDSYVMTNKDTARPRDEIPDLDANQKVVQAQKDLGFAKEAINLKDFADLSLIKEANERLK